MDDAFRTSEQSETPPKGVRLKRRVLVFFVAGIGLYLLAAYVVVPAVWMRYAAPSSRDGRRSGHHSNRRRHPRRPAQRGLDRHRERGQENYGGRKWYAADPLGLRSDLQIAADTVLKRPDDQVPVSSLYLFGRKEDLAFEQPVGDSPRKRNHVRFWRSDKIDSDGRPLWLGSATFDERVGLSHTTGQITHHIAPDVDTERDHLFQDLKADRHTH